MIRDILIFSPLCHLFTFRLSKMSMLVTCVQMFKYLKFAKIPHRNASIIQNKLKDSYHFKLGDVPLISATLGRLVDDAAVKDGDTVSFVSAHQGISKNYTEFRQEVVKLASGLISLGLRKGDRIAIWSPNCYEWPVVQYASAKAGLILVNLNPAYQASEVEYCLKKVRCKAIISWDQLKKQDFYKIFQQILPELPKYKHGKIDSKSLPCLERIILISNESKEGTLNYHDVLNAGNADSNELLTITEKSIQFDDPVNIQFTSGTTGNPKAAILSHHNIVNNAMLCGRRSLFHLHKSVACCQVPLFHCFGCVFASLSAVIFHNTCVFPSSIFNGQESLEAIEKYKCTIIYGTPTMYMDLLDKYRNVKSNVETLKEAIVGGAASPESLITDMKNELGLSRVILAYGSTENSPAVSGSQIDEDFELIVKGVMTSYEYLELKIVDDEGHLLPINTQGELCVRGHAVFMGYWEDPEKTDEVVEKSGWYHTGDLCVMDENGRIKIVGRKKDMVIRGGENLFPIEIENFLHTHPAILEAQVIGVPDERMGEELCAWICLKNGENLTEEELRKYCQGKISHFKIPRYIIFVEDFPKTVSGKIKKFEMKRISMEKLNL